MAPRKKPNRRVTQERVAAGRALLASLPRLSETMLRFGKPLLDVLSSPPTRGELDRALQIVTVAWNLPLYERDGHPRAAEFRRMFDAAMANAPPEGREILGALLYARLSRYASDPRLGFLEVREGTDDEAQVVATAMLPA